MRSNERNGEVVGAVQVFEGDELMLISDMGTLVRTSADEVSVLSRNTQGVRLIKLRGEEQLNSVARIVESNGGSNGDDVEDRADEEDGEAGTAGTVGTAGEGDQEDG